MTDVEALWKKTDWPVVGTLWEHLKTGNIYQITGRSLREADLKPLVSYVPWAKGWHPIWTRPLEEFRERFKPC